MYFFKTELKIKKIKYINLYIFFFKFFLKESINLNRFNKT